MREATTAANTDGIRETLFEPERMGFSSAGEFVSRSGLVRSAGHPRVFLTRAQRPGCLLFGYFLLDKQEKVPRPRFGNRKYKFLHRLIARRALNQTAC